MLSDNYSRNKEVKEGCMMSKTETNRVRKAGDNITICRFNNNVKTISIERIGKETKHLECKETEKLSIESFASYHTRNSFSVVLNDSDDGIGKGNRY